jgi:hypothetical protein
MKVTDEMVNRFLSWKLPEDFHPDAGISFSPLFNVEYNAKLGIPPARHQPIGTNLFNADQARAMLEHVLAPAPEAMAQEDALREAVKRHVRATAAEIKENAEALKQYDWEKNEARCRELCAMYLEEIALSMDMGDRIAELSRLAMNVCRYKRGENTDFCQNCGGTESSHSPQSGRDS